MEDDGLQQQTDGLPMERLRQTFFLSTDSDILNGTIMLVTIEYCVVIFRYCAGWLA